MLGMKAQRLYVDVVSGEMGAFDSWASNWSGYYRLSTGQFVKRRVRNMRAATVAEQRLFQRSKQAGMEATANA